MRINVHELTKTELRALLFLSGEEVRLLPAQGQRRYLIMTYPSRYYEGGAQGGSLGGNLKYRGVWDMSTYRTVRKLVRWNRRRMNNLRKAMERTLKMVRL